MSNTFRYLIMATVTLGLTFGYIKTKGTAKPIDIQNESEIKVYPITQFFQMQALSSIDSTALCKEQKQNLAFLAQLIDVQNNLSNDFARLSPCGNGKNPTNCVYTLVSGCYPCTKCCQNSLFRPDFDPNPAGFRIVAYEKMNLHFYNKGKELTLSSTLTKNLRTVEVPRNTAMDRITINIGKLREISMLKQ